MVYGIALPHCVESTTVVLTHDGGTSMLVLTLRGKTEELPDDQAFDAMRRMYEAKKAGDRTAKLIRAMDEVVSSSNPLTTSEDEELGNDHLMLMKQHERTLQIRGTALPPPIYAPGFPLMEVFNGSYKGGTYRIPRFSWEQLPLISGGIKSICKMIRREERQQYTVKLSNIIMHNDGAISFGRGPFFLEEDALKRLLTMTKVFPSGAMYLSQIQPSLRARNWAVRTETILNNQEIAFRVRKNPLTGRFSIFAVVTTAYSPVDIDQLFEHVGSLFEDHRMRGHVFYDSTSADFRLHAYWPEETQIHTKGSSDWFRKGIRIATNDTGTGGIEIRGIALRSGCNGRFLTSHQPLLHTHHQGNMRRISDIDGVFQRLDVEFDQFCDLWSAARGRFPTYLGRGIPEICRALKLPVGHDQALQLFTGMKDDASVADVLIALGRLHSLPEVPESKVEKMEQCCLQILEDLK